jgi:hypothetical protein
MLAAIGKRPLGLEAGQLLALTRWAQEQWRARQLRVETAGPRSQGVGLVAAALEPGLFAEAVTHAGLESLRYLLDEPVPYEEAPELFCLDLYKEFDLDRLAAIAGPTSVVALQNLKLTSKLKSETETAK